MSRIFKTRIPIHELSYYILTRGLFLTFLFLAAAVALLAGNATWLAIWYAEYLFTMGAVLLATSLIGPLLVEDILRR
ncbi:MAG: hypothetical protein EOM52_02055 [Clostridia bacterium]|nr:hypothetical protein [Clostridia bacterium]